MADESAGSVAPAPAGQAASAPTPTTTEAPAPIDWGTHIPKEVAGEKLWESYKGKPLGDVLKSFVDAQKYNVGALKLPDEKDPERSKKMGAVYKKLGRPDSPDEYEVTPPSLPEGMTWNEDLDKGFRKEAHALGLNAAQVAGIYKFYGGMLEPLASRLADERRAGEAKLKEEWGANYTRNHELATRTVKELARDALGEEEGAAFVKEVAETSLGNNLRLVKLFAALGNELVAEGQLHLGDEMSGSSLKQQYEELTKYDTQGPYWNKNHPNHEEAYKHALSLLERIGFDEKVQAR